MSLRPLTLALAASLALLLVPASSQAQRAEIPIESPKIVNMGLGFGWMFFQDTEFQSVYSNKGRFVTKLQVGFVPWSKYVHVEINGTFGFSQFREDQVVVSTGADSADGIMFTVFPVGVDFSFGVDLVHEQPVVPYGGIGLNWTIFRENEVGGGQVWNGYRFGPSPFFGAAILLDWIERGRAAEVDSKAGINDAFFTIEGRYNGLQRKFEGGALVEEQIGLQSWQVVMGIKLVI